MPSFEEVSNIDSSTEGYTRSPGPRLLAVTMVAGHGLKHLYGAAFMVIFPEIKLGLGLSNFAAGALVMSRDVSSGVAAMPGGFIADRYSSMRPLILMAAMMLVAFGYLASGSLQAYYAIALAVVLVGVGTSLWHPTAIAALSDRFPERRGLALTMHGAGAGMGEVLGPLLAGALLQRILWPRLLQYSFLPAALAAIVVWLALRGLKSQPGAASIREYFSTAAPLLKNRRIMSVVALCAMVSMGDYAMATFLPIYLREHLEFSTLKVGVYISLLHTIGIATQPILGFVSDRYGRKAALVPELSAFGMLCVAVAYAEPGTQLLLTIIAIGAVTYTYLPIFVAITIDLSPAGLHGTSVGLVYTGTMAVGAFGAVLGGLVADGLSIESTFIFAGITNVAAALLLIALPTRPRPS